MLLVGPLPLFGQFVSAEDYKEACLQDCTISEQNGSGDLFGFSATHPASPEVSVAHLVAILKRGQ